MPPGALTTVRARTLFTPLSAGCRASTVAGQLSQAIGLGLLLDGERLPAESELAGQLGVSTVTLREALAALRRQGLVGTRRGRGGGSFVRAPADQQAERLAQPLLRLSLHELQDIGDHRAAIAGAASRLAAQRSLPADISALREHAERLRGAGPVTDRRRADARLHIEIAAAAQSPRLTQQEMDLWSQIGDLVWLPGPDDDLAAVAREHDALIDAIEARRGGRARELAEQHVARQTARLLAVRLGRLR